MLFAFALTGFLLLTAALCLALPRLAPATFADQRACYIENHRTLGCRITHMIGVPLIVVAFPALTLGWQWLLGLFVFGWVLQFIGHFVFEGNSPVLISNPKNRFTVVYAVIFVVEEWTSLFTGKSLHGK